MTATLLNSLLRALLRWGAALVFCLPLRHRSHFWGRACGMLFPLLLLVQLLSGAVFFAAVYILLARQLPYKGEYLSLIHI